MDDRRALACVFYILRTGIQWNALPRQFGASSTVHDRFQEWVKDGVFDRLHTHSLDHYDREYGIQWEWQSCDGAMVKAPLAWDHAGPNPTDRGKRGTKRSVLSDALGAPLSVVIAGANVNDHILLDETLEDVAIDTPIGITENICLDKGYDYPLAREAVAKHGYIPHIRSRGEEKLDLAQRPGTRARRWVIERTHGWLNRYRRILIRWEKKSDNYLALIQLACANQLSRMANWVSG